MEVVTNKPLWETFSYSREPFLDTDFADPCFLATGENEGYLYATQNFNRGVNCQIARYKNNRVTLLNKDVLPNLPKGLEDESFCRCWAPHVIRLDYSKAPEYRLYYAGRVAGHGLGIWAAYSSSPEGPFIPTDRPLVYGKHTSDGSNIDPFVTTRERSDNGSVRTVAHLLYWGSMGAPIRSIPLTDDGLAVNPKEKPKVVFTPTEELGTASHVEAPHPVNIGDRKALLFSTGATFVPDSYSIDLATLQNGKDWRVQKLLKEYGEFKNVGHPYLIDTKSGQFMLFAGIHKDLLGKPPTPPRLPLVCQITFQDNKISIIS